MYFSLELSVYIVKLVKFFSFSCLGFEHSPEGCRQSFLFPVIGVGFDAILIPRCYTIIINQWFLYIYDPSSVMLNICLMKTS